MIKAIYVNDKNEFYKFGKFHNFIGNARHIYIFSGILVLIGLLMIVNSFFTSFEYALASLIFFGFAVLMPFANWFKLNNKIKSSIKANKNYFNTKSTYMFEKKHIKIQIDINGKVDEHRLKYSDFIKAYQTKTNFYLYLNDHSALIILNSNIVQGNDLGLASILKENLGKKFKTKAKLRSK